MVVSKAVLCRRPPNTATKNELVARHKAKMKGKFFRNQDPNWHVAGRLKNHQGVI